MKQRLFAFLLSVALLLCTAAVLSPGTALALDAPALTAQAVTLPPNSQTVSINIHLTGLYEGLDVGLLDLRIAYDAEKLTPIAVDRGSAGAAFDSFQKPSLGIPANPLTVLAYSTSAPMAENGVFCTLTFRIHAGWAGQTIIDISESKVIALTTEQQIAFSLENGTVNLTAPVYAFTASPRIKSFGALEEGYEAPAAQVVTLTNTGTGSLSLLQPTANHFTVGALSALTLAPQGMASFTITPKTALTAGVYSETIAVCTSQGVSVSIEVNMLVTPVGGTAEDVCQISLQKRQVHESDTLQSVSVSVNLTGLTASDQVGLCSMKIAYPAEKLSLIHVQNGTFSAFESKQKSPGYSSNPYALLGWTTDTDMIFAENGTFITLTFQVLTGWTGDAEISVFDVEVLDIYTDKDISKTILTQNGSVTVIPVLSGDINTDGAVNVDDLVLLSKYITGWTVSINTKAADVTSDSFLNVDDISLLAKYIAGWDVTLGEAHRYFAE